MSIYGLFATLCLNVFNRGRFREVQQTEGPPQSRALGRTKHRNYNGLSGGSSIPKLFYTIPTCLNTSAIDVPTDLRGLVRHCKGADREDERIQTIGCCIGMMHS